MAGSRFGGSSTLPHLNQKHGASGISTGGRFIRRTPEPSLVVATWKMGLNGGLGACARPPFLIARWKDSPTLERPEPSHGLAGAARCWRVCACAGGCSLALLQPSHHHG